MIGTTMTTDRATAVDAPATPHTGLALVVATAQLMLALDDTFTNIALPQHGGRPRSR
jgi:hypothetical protein